MSFQRATDASERTAPVASELSIVAEKSTSRARTWTCAWPGARPFEIGVAHFAGDAQHLLGLGAGVSERLQEILAAAESGEPNPHQPLPSPGRKPPVA
jgi:hypothetical protein